MTGEEPQQVSAEMVFINHQDELLKKDQAILELRREILGLRQLAFNRSIIGMAQRDGSKVLTVHETQILPDGKTLMVVVEKDGLDPEPVKATIQELVPGAATTHGQARAPSTGTA